MGFVWETVKRLDEAFVRVPDVLLGKPVVKMMIVRVKRVTPSPIHVEVHDWTPMSHVASIRTVKEMCVQLDSSPVRENWYVVPRDDERTLVVLLVTTFVPTTLQVVKDVRRLIPMGIRFVKVGRVWRILVSVSNY